MTAMSNADCILSGNPPGRNQKSDSPFIVIVSKPSSSSDSCAGETISKRSETLAAGSVAPEMRSQPTNELSMIPLHSSRSPSGPMTIGAENQIVPGGTKPGGMLSAVALYSSAEGWTKVRDSVGGGTDVSSVKLPSSAR